MKRKLGQSEMVGFGIIVIIVSILILVFISLSLNKSPTTGEKDYQGESFVQSYLQFTTNCSVRGTRISNLDLITKCANGETCDGGENSCTLLNETTKGILENSWQVGSEFPTKGYKFSVSLAGNNLIDLSKGNKTANSRGSRQVFSGGLEVDFTSYS